MGRTTAAVLVALVVTLARQTAVAAQIPVVFAFGSGFKFVLLDIDLNNDGPGQHDCDFRAMYDPTNHNFSMASVQNPDLPAQPINGCGHDTGGTLTFGSDTGGDFAAMRMTSSTYGAQMPDPQPGLDTPLTLLGLMKFIAAANALPDTAAAITMPLNVNKLEIHVPADGPATTVVDLCSLNGPAGVFTFPSTSILIQFSYFIDDMNRTFLKLPKFPYGQGTGFTMLDAYIPLLGHKIIASLDGDPDHPLATIDFDALPQCAGRHTMAPTMTEVGLMALLVLLLVAGSWHLGRRATFYKSLPTV